MTKAELIAHLAAQVQLTKAETAKLLSALINGMTGILQSQGKLTLPGLGVFTVRERPARTGRPSQTGAPIAITASKAVKFKAGKALQEAVQ